MKNEEFNAIGTIVLDADKKRLALKSPAYYNQCLARLPIGAEVTVTISTKKATRSEQQLKYYFVLLGLISDHTGYRTDELHDYVMREVFGTKTITLNGKSTEVRQSISHAARMPKYEAQRTIEYVLELCTDLGIYVPTMAELGYLPS